VEKADIYALYSAFEKIWDRAKQHTCRLLDEAVQKLATKQDEILSLNQQVASKEDEIVDLREELGCVREWLWFFRCKAGKYYKDYSDVFDKDEQLERYGESHFKYFSGIDLLIIPDSSENENGRVTEEEEKKKG
jgi:hypothetical protein